MRRERRSAETTSVRSAGAVVRSRVDARTPGADYLTTRNARIVPWNSPQNSVHWIRYSVPT
ncbi:MAG: hypothetical protein ACRECR_00865, partial [Thermoplasmata archaeon]